MVVRYGEAHSADRTGCRNQDAQGGSSLGAPATRPRDGAMRRVRVASFFFFVVDGERYALTVLFFDCAGDVAGERGDRAAGL